MQSENSFSDFAEARMIFGRSLKDRFWFYLYQASVPLAVLGNLYLRFSLMSRARRRRHQQREQK